MRISSAEGFYYEYEITSWTIDINIQKYKYKLKSKIIMCRVGDGQGCFWIMQTFFLWIKILSWRLLLNLRINCLKRHIYKLFSCLWTSWIREFRCNLIGGKLYLFQGKRTYGYTLLLKKLPEKHIHAKIYIYIYICTH